MVEETLVPFRSRLRTGPGSERTAAILGIALGVGFVVCFVTGVLSHLIQDPPSWFSWPPRPAGLYRVTQGLHVIVGIALIPLVLAKLWFVYPKFFVKPPVRSVAHAIERLSLLPLVGGALFLLFTGLANINLWRPWEFGFREGHYATAWITIGALVVHVGAKWVTTTDALRRGAPRVDAGPEHGEEAEGSLDRRGFLGTAFLTSGALALFTMGQTFEPLRKLALLSPRRPDVGPQGFPVNRTAASVGLTEVDLDDWTLTVDGPAVAEPLVLTYDDVLGLPRHEATLPITCVEGWSTTQTWAGVRVRDLLERAGVTDVEEVTVVSIQRSRRQKTSPLTSSQAGDPDTLLALEVNGETLAPDHGFPLRLIGPNRPGVHQTKWVGELQVS